MEKYQELAWGCLTPQEQHSLSLTLTQGMSTWEVGEIMKLSHYKYLELKDRSEKFFRMFSDYFYKWGDLVRPGCPIDERFRDYLYGAILKRLPKKEAVLYAGDSAWLVHPIRNNHIEDNIKVLKDGDHEWDLDLFKLIMEFDRWNNFRILPQSLQAPSAYRRRRNKNDKKYLKYLHQIPEFKIRALVDMYWSKGRLDKRHYTSFISEEVFPEVGYAVVPIKKSQDIYNNLTELRIYIFEDIEDAETFGNLANRFFEKTIDNKAGMKFWEEYREVIEKAINYKEVNNIIFTCDSLDYAYNLKRKTRKKNSTQKEKY